MDADPRDLRIQQLEAENQSLRQRVQELEELVNKLTDRIEQLEREAHRQAAPFRRKDKDRKPPGQHRSPGRPKGHPPAHREQPPQADDHVQVELQACPHCGRAVTDVQACEQFIEDIPLARPRVTRLVTYRGTCPRCGEVRSTHPMQVSTAVGAAGTHLGRRALALAADVSLAEQAKAVVDETLDAFGTVDILVNNAGVELKRLVEMTVTRLENWKVEVERNPNPRLVHVLKNIIAQIESLTELTEAKISYSYKALSRQMSILVDEVAKLNIAITDSLLEDDLIDEAEEERINESLKQVFQAAVQLIRIVQQAFMLRHSQGRLPE